MSIKDLQCPKCGVKVNKLVNGYCVDCFLKNIKIKIPAKIKLRYCVKCESVYWNRSWIKPLNSIMSLFERELKNKIRVPEEVELKSVVIDDFEKGLFSIFLSMKDELFEIQEKTIFILEKVVCPDCSRQNTKYIAKIQVRFVRNYKKNKEALQSFMKKYSMKLIRIEEFDRGFDYHFSVDSYAVDVSRKISNAFNGKVKETFELFSWDKDKNKPRTRRIIMIKSLC